MRLKTYKERRAFGGGFTKDSGQTLRDTVRTTRVLTSLSRRAEPAHGPSPCRVAAGRCSAYIARGALDTPTKKARFAHRPRKAGANMTVEEREMIRREREAMKEGST